MKIINLTENSRMYTSNVYLVLGSWNAIGDMNTLIDVGRDPLIIERINWTPTGVGKKHVDQVVLTHCHYDHAGLLPLIDKHFDPVVYAYTRSLERVDHILKDGDVLNIGDRMFEVIYGSAHSNDSVCLYCGDERVLFTGDLPVMIQSIGGSYDEDFIKVIERLCRKDIQAIFPGHGNPIFNDCNGLLRSTLKNIRKSKRLTGQLTTQTKNGEETNNHGFP